MQRKLKVIFSFVIALAVVTGLLFAAILDLGNFWLNWIFFVTIFIFSTVLYIFWLEKFDIFELRGTTVMDRGIPRPDIASTIENTIMEYAEECIIMFHGALSSIFFDASEVIEALRGTKGSKLDIRIVCGPEIKVENQEFFRLVKDGKVLLYQLLEEDNTGEKGKFHHFACVDNRHSWLELYHEPDQCAGGKEWIDEPIVAGRCMSKYRKLIRKSKVVDAKNIIASIGRNKFVQAYDRAKREWKLATDSQLAELARKIGEEN